MAIYMLAACDGSTAAELEEALEDATAWLELLAACDELAICEELAAAKLDEAAIDDATVRLELLLEGAFSSELLPPRPIPTDELASLWSLIAVLDELPTIGMLDWAAWLLLVGGAINEL